MPIAKQCEHCGREFKKPESHARRSRFCSKGCYKLWRQPSGESKRCTSCGELRPLQEYSPRAGFPFGAGSHCRACKRRNNNERNRAQRTAVINAYGGHCACCGEDAYEFLALDHISGGGNRHRRQVTSQALYRTLIKQGFPRGEYQLLCHNCNMAKGFYGVCPHQRKLPNAA